MNVYRIKVELDVIAKDDETAIELVKNDINENDTEIQDIQIIWSEEYNQKGKIMSETEKFVGKIQLRPRLKNEADKIILKE